MFVAFEGIDGSGKTTVSNRAARKLEQAGIAVSRPRREGVLGSAIAAEVRTITRSPKHLTLDPRAELMLIAAREAQLFAEITGPALDRGDWVIADRSVLTPLVAATARGIPWDEARSVCGAAVGGRFPDQVVVCDIDPRLARIRKRLDKIRKDSFGDRGRKGLLGEAYKERIRRGLLELARQDKDRYAVLDARLPVKKGTKLVAQRLLALHEGHRPAPLPDLGEDPPLVSPEELESPDLAELLGERFLDFVEGIGAEDVGAASYLLIGVRGDRAQALREKYADDEPAIVAYGLGGLSDEEAWELRERLADAAPAAVARSLRGGQVRIDPRAWALRDRLAARAPVPIARGLSGFEDEAAMALRRTLREAAPEAVVAGLRRCVGTEARKLLGEFGPAHPNARVEAMVGRDDEEAWRARGAALGEFPAQVLSSLRGVESDRAWAIRRKYARLAPKAVLRSLGRSVHAEAWRLREEIGGESRAVLDSVRALDIPEAWSIRERYRDTWPNAAVASLGRVSTTDRGRDFARTTLEKHPSDLLTLRRTAQALARGAVADDELDTEE